ncbi:MAG TPA: carbohydrate ABC transporter permease [Mesotoga infera]|uniref:Carbohydrate ABC transporter permease n=1 Tax=Mesotoga infera TaxID=1236046 RepID=A0A7C1H3L7_9BACT|nr:carbohydrate ABC transporter permease [Mesotoga infera]
MKKIITSIIIYVSLILGAVIMCFPFYYMIITSLKESAYIFTIPPQLVPDPATLKNYVSVWIEADFKLYFWNSVKITVPAVLLNVFLSSLTAYGFARFKFPGKELWFSILIATLAVPGLLLTIPQFDMVRRVKFLMDNPLTIMLTSGIGSVAFNAFFLRGFFEGIPVELEEAAELDGCNAFKTFWKVAMPMARPALATLVILSFMGVWDDYFWPSLILRERSQWTLPIGILGFRAQHSVQWHLLFAGTMIAILPVLVIYVVFQKYFVKTVAEGGLKL